MSSTSDWTERFVFAVLAVLAVGYSVLQSNFVRVRLVIALFVLYLLWRFVRTHERIAAALDASPVETTDD